MYYKSFNIFIQNFFSKFFIINEFYFLDGGQNLGNGIRPLGEFLLGKLDVNVIKDKKKYVKDHFYANLSQ